MNVIERLLCLCTAEITVIKQNKAGNHSFPSTQLLLSPGRIYLWGSAGKVNLNAWDGRWEMQWVRCNRIATPEEPRWPRWQGRTDLFETRPVWRETSGWWGKLERKQNTGRGFQNSQKAHCWPAPPHLHSNCSYSLHPAEGDTFPRLILHILTQRINVFSCTHLVRQRFYAGAVLGGQEGPVPLTGSLHQ